MRTLVKTKKKPKKTDLKFILDFYDASLRGDDMAKIAAALDIGRKALVERIEKSEDLQMAQKLANERQGGRNTLSGYVFKQLSPEAREVWKQVQFWTDSNASYEKIESILGGKSKKLRQELFVHALVHSNFDVSTACTMVGVTRRCLEHWRKDLEFRQLIEEIQWHKKNFFERALVDLVEIRHPGATIFVNKTMNADRGYSEKLQVEHSGSVTTGVRIEDLDLDLETRKKILLAIRDVGVENVAPTKPSNMIPLSTG